MAPEFLRGYPSSRWEGGDLLCDLALPRFACNTLLEGAEWRAPFRSLRWVACNVSSWRQKAYEDLFKSAGTGVTKEVFREFVQVAQITLEESFGTPHSGAIKSNQKTP